MRDEGVKEEEEGVEEEERGEMWSTILLNTQKASEHV